MANKIRRVLNIVLDACGCGNAPDAAQYGDEGANTLLHVIQTKNPDIPNLMELGLGNVLGFKNADVPVGCYGRMTEKAVGKDTTSGHWEIAGLTLQKPFPTYPNGFPPEVIEAFERETGMQVIGNKPASGTEVLAVAPQHVGAAGGPVLPRDVGKRSADDLCHVCFLRSFFLWIGGSEEALWEKFGVWSQELGVAVALPPAKL